MDCGLKIGLFEALEVLRQFFREVLATGAEKLKHMTGRTSESVRFESREEDNKRLREENARLSRLLAAHGIPLVSGFFQKSTQHSLRICPIHTVVLVDTFVQ